MRRFLPLCPFVLLGCTDAPATPPGVTPPAEDFTDLRVPLPEAPALEDGELFEVPWMEIAPGQEVIYCWYGTHRGPATGVNSLVPLHTSEYHHHGLLKEAFDDDPPDGTIEDCTAPEEQWPPRPTLFERVGGTGGEDWVNLPDGIAFKLEEGQRFVADMHFINTSDKPIVVNYGFLLGFIPLDEVRGIAGTFNMDAGGFVLQPGELSSEVFSCPWEEEITVLSLGGHMHDFGAAYTVSHERDGEEPEPLYDVPMWTPAYRYSPPTTTFADGEVVARPGDRFLTDCSWYNDTGSPLRYPDEMCTTFGVGYPLPDNYYCDEGDIIDTREATVRGDFRLDVSVPGDGVGDVTVFMTTEEPQEGRPPGEGQRFFIEGVDLSEPGARVPFVLEPVRPSAQVFYITAWLDDDGEGMGPSTGDPMAIVNEVVIDDGGEFEVDIPFTMTAP